MDTETDAYQSFMEASRDIALICSSIIEYLKEVTQVAIRFYTRLLATIDTIVSIDIFSLLYINCAYVV